MPQIILESAPATGNSSGHLYLVYRGVLNPDTGLVDPLFDYVIRGGPGSNTSQGQDGDLVLQYSNPEATTLLETDQQNALIDDPLDLAASTDSRSIQDPMNDRAQTSLQNTSLDHSLETWREMMKIAEAIHVSNYEYDALSTNSNATISNILKFFDIDTTEISIASTFQTSDLIFIDHIGINTAFNLFYEIDGTTIITSDSGQIFGTMDNDWVGGQSTSETITTLAGNDKIYGNAGDDIIDSGVGNDLLYGGTGENTLYGGKDNDYLYGGQEKDLLYGGEGDDAMFGQGGLDKIYGEQDNDRLYAGVATDTNNNGIFGEVYTDSNGNEIHETEQLHYSDAANASVELYGGSGNDYLLGGRMQDALYGGADDDTVMGSVASDNLYGDDIDNLLQGDDFIYGQGGGDFMYGGQGVDKMNGGSGNDRLYGGDNGDTSADVLMGEDGEDKLYGYYGDDLISGGLHDDYIKGGAGDDWIVGDGGDDQLYGGAGSDTFYFREWDGSDVIMDFESGDVLEIEHEMLNYVAGYSPNYEQQLLDSGNVTTANGNTYIQLAHNQTLTLSGFTGLSTSDLSINLGGDPPAYILDAFAELV